MSPLLNMAEICQVYPVFFIFGSVISGNFHAGEQPGAILKKFDSSECKSFHKLMKDVLRPYVPEFRGEAAKDGERILSFAIVMT